jgi:hypothetical protein
MTWLAWVVIGLGAAGVAGAVVIEGMNARKKQKKEEAAREKTDAVPFNEIPEQ